MTLAKDLQQNTTSLVTIPDVQMHPPIESRESLEIVCRSGRRRRNAVRSAADPDYLFVRTNPRHITRDAGSHCSHS
jgi:hypothetical protein